MEFEETQVDTTSVELDVRGASSPLHIVRLNPRQYMYLTIGQPTSRQMMHGILAQADICFETSSTSSSRTPGYRARDRLN